MILFVPVVLHRVLCDLYFKVTQRHNGLHKVHEEYCKVVIKANEIQTF